MAPLRLSDVLRTREKALRERSFDTPDLDIRFLVEASLNPSVKIRSLDTDREISEDEMKLIDARVARRLKGEPIARILGQREFWSLPFDLNEATLEPRPDSERLVELALTFLVDKQKSLRILDLGTGTGCLLLSILSERPHAIGLGIDIAPRAIEQARLNAEHLGLHQRATFEVGNWMSNIEGFFDLIVANPPYIEKETLSQLMPEVRLFDPLRALDGGLDGLDAYRIIIPSARQHMALGAQLVIEVGHTQASAVQKLLLENGYINIGIHKDYGGIERCVTAELKE